MLTVAAQQIHIGIDNHFPTLGPIAHQMQYDKVMAYFDTARDGATIITGGEKAPVKVWTKAYTSSRLFSQM
jgi:acyl-CoA reductase-like NAD-dependent aldehyde dehydrogenase